MLRNIKMASLIKRAIDSENMNKYYNDKILYLQLLKSLCDYLEHMMIWWFRRYKKQAKSKIRNKKLSCKYWV